MLVDHVVNVWHFRPENLRRSVTAINAALRGTKRLDLFECARVDHNHSIEDTTRTLAALIKEGLFDHIGMSECSAETLRRANAVHPITAVEIEVSPWSYEEETKKGTPTKFLAQIRTVDILFSLGDRSGVEYRCSSVLVRRFSYIHIEGSMSLVGLSVVAS